MINVVAIMGRLTYDPELRTTPTGVSVVRFQVAVDRNFQRAGEERVASNVSFCGSKAESGTTGANSNPAFAQPAPSYASADNSDFEEIVDDDDDLPF